MNDPKVPGFTKHPKRTAQHQIYRGRFTCPDVQWIEARDQTLCTFTIAAAQLADAAQTGLIWTDQDVQRGIQPGVTPVPPKLLSLADGYPDRGKYIFNSAKADDIVQKLLYGEKLFLNPLIWNLRPNSFDAHWDQGTREIYIYTGRVYLPNSHHRHQAIVKAVSIWRETPREYTKFSDDTQFKIELYFLTREDEGNYFFDRINYQSQQQNLRHSISRHKTIYLYLQKQLLTTLFT